MKKINLITHTNDGSRSTLFRRFANLPLENQLQICKLTLNYQFQNAQKLTSFSNSEKLLIALIDVIFNYTESKKFNRYDLENERKKLQKQEKIKVSKIKNKYRKKANKTDKLRSKQYWLIVQKLKLIDKLSYRAIAEYLSIYHKFKINYTTIAKVWKEMEDVK